MVQPKEQYNDIEVYNIPGYQADYILKLDANENPLGCSTRVIKALSNISPTQIARYPAFGLLEEKIAETINEPVENISVTNGGDSAIKAIYNTFLDSDSEVLYAEPSFIMYKICAQRLNAKVVTVPYEKKWLYPTETIIQNINERTRVIPVCSPNNPTGDHIPDEDLIRILEAAPHCIVMLDEAYYRFTSRPIKSMKHLINKYDNLIILHTFSKDYGLAGLRLGYIISTPENVRNVRKATDPFHVNAAAVAAGLAALSDQDFVNNYVEIVQDSKKFMLSALKEVSEEVYDSEGNFILFKVGPRQEWLHSKLLKKYIKVRRYPNNPELDGYIRLTLTPVDQMKLVLQYLKDYEAVVFDIDGVLIDESRSYRKAIKMTYEHFSNKSITLDKIQEFKNQGGFINDWILTKHLLELENINIELDKVIEKFQEFYFNDGNGLIKEEEMLINPQLLEKMKDKYTMALFTGRPIAEAEFILKEKNIRHYFDHIIAMEDCQPDKSKPHPYGLNCIIEKLGTSNLVLLGDMPDDIIAANKANIDSAGILPPQDKSQQLKELLLSKGAIEVYENINTALYRIFGISAS